MATLNGVFHEAVIVERYGGSMSPLMAAQVLFTIAGTYVQGDNAQLQAVPTLIKNSIRNGKTVTLVDAMCGHPATKESNPALMMALKTVTIVSADITFEITESATANVPDFSTELAAGVVPAQDRPFCLIVTYIES